MAEFNFIWDTRVERSVTIEAETKEAAFKIWTDGDYGETNIDDEDMLTEHVTIDGETYYNDRCEKVRYSS